MSKPASPNNLGAARADITRAGEPNNTEFHQSSSGDLLVTGIAVAIIAFSLLAAFFLHNYQLKKEKEITAAVSRAVVRELESDVFELEKSIARISSVQQGNQDMSRVTFWKLMRQPIRDLKALQIIAWAPIVDTHGMERWVKAQQKIKQELLTYQTVRALRNLRPRYFHESGTWQDDPKTFSGNAFVQNWVSPILFIEDEIGKVLNSAKHFKAAISQATKSGEMRSASSQENSKGEWINTLFSPIYKQPISPGKRKDLQREREKQVTGMLNFQINLSAMLEACFAENNNKSLDISVSEALPGGGYHTIFETSDRLSKQDFDAVESVDFFGQDWQLRVHRESLAMSVQLPPALAVLVGLVMTAALLIWHRNNHRFKQKLRFKLNEQKLEITKKTGLLEAVIDAAPVGIEYIDEAGIPQLQNNLAQIGTGTQTALSAIQSGNAKPVHNPQYGHPALTHYQLSMHDGERDRHFEIISQNFDGTSCGQLGSVIVCSDVTERETTNRKLESYVNELETTNRELREFTYSATHNMQEPLRRIASFSEIISEQLLDGDVEETGELAKRLMNLSADLRTRFALVVEEIDRRDRRRAEDDDLAFLASTQHIDLERDKP